MKLTKPRVGLIIALFALMGLGIAWWNYSLGPLPLRKNVANEAGGFSLAKPVPVPRTESGGTVLNGRFYLVGGLGARGQTLTSFMEFDPSKDAWRRLPDLPQPINHPGVVAAGDKIYVVGGFKPLGIRPHGVMLADWRPLDTLYVFDVRENRWSKGPPMPEPRGAGGVALSDGAIWYAGGINQTRNISSGFFRLDLSAGTWRTMPPMPTARDHMRLEAVGSGLYAISGRQDDLRRNLAVTERYDIAGERWTRAADIPTARGGMATVVWGNSIYAFGGEYPWTCLDEVDRYDVENDKWEVLGPLPEARHGIVAGAMDDGIHLVSGGRHPRISISGIHRIFKPHPEK